MARRRRVVLWCGILAGLGVGILLPVVELEIGALLVGAAVVLYRNRRAI